MEIDTNSFQRRRHSRYSINQSVILLVNKEGRLINIPGEIINLSRYGLCLRIGDDISIENSETQVRFTFPNFPLITAGFKFSRKIDTNKGSIQLAGDLSFPDENVRRTLHSFLSTLKEDTIQENRKEERRRNTVAENENRRNGDRRRNLGIFTECTLFSIRSSSWRSQYTNYQPAESKRPGYITIKGRELISFASKDYLGLSHDPRVKEAAIKAIELYGTSVNGSRALNGTLPIHEELENELAKLKNAEAAIIFPGGYFTNIGIISALLKKSDIAFIDEKSHPSIIDGCLAAGARIIVFRHNSIDDLEKKIRRLKPSRSLIIAEGVYSVEGDLGNIPGILEVARIYGIPLMIDDAHGIGVMGKTGAGTVEHFGLKGEVDLDMGIFSAALAGIGGFVACKKYIADYLLHFSRGILFTTALTPSTTAGLLEALRITKTDPLLRDRLWSNIKRLRTGLRDIGYDLGPTESAVMSIQIGNEQTTYDIMRMLENQGVYVNAFRRPAVKRGEAKIRISASAVHSEEDITHTLNTFKEIKPKLDEKMKLHC